MKNIKNFQSRISVAEKSRASFRTSKMVNAFGEFTVPDAEKKWSRLIAETKLFWHGTHHLKKEKLNMDKLQVFICSDCRMCT